MLIEKPESFLAVFTPRRNNDPNAPRAQLPFQAQIETAEYTITLNYNTRDMLTTSADSKRLVLLSGDLYKPQNASGSTVLDLYERRGPDFVKDLHGRYCLLLIDQQADQILLVTDRINSNKILVRWNDGTLTASNSIYLQPRQQLNVDRTAAASYLAAGFLYNDRTLFEEIKILDGASAYRLRSGQMEAAPYWQFIFDPGARATSPAALKKDLGDLLVEAVRVRLRADRLTYLSLSAGEDARAILGVLAHYLHVDDVRCFSYALGSPRPDSDEALSAQLAALAGYRHQLVRSFDGDAVRTLLRNGQFGGGMARVCDEVDAWIALGATVGNGPQPVMFSGETRFFHYDFEVKNADDAAAASSMNSFTALDWLKNRIGPARYNELVARTRSEIERAVQGVPATKDGYDLRDMLGFRQIQNRSLNTWREYYAGRFFRQAQPLMDDDILDLFLRTPAHLRRGKRLYLQTVTEMFPALFALPRATNASYASYWPETIRQQSAALRAFIEGKASPLDHLIDPDVLLGLLTVDMPSLTRTNERITRSIQAGYRLLKRANMSRIPLARPSLLRAAVPAHKFLTRALVLRSFLTEMAEQPTE